MTANKIVYIKSLCNNKRFCHTAIKASANIVFKVHKNLYWPQQKTIIVYNQATSMIQALLTISNVMLYWYDVIHNAMENESETKSIQVLIKQYQILRNVRWQHDSQLNIVFKVHKNLYWPQQKTNCIK
jgi:hypothetical protein